MAKTRRWTVLIGVLVLVVAVVVAAIALWPRRPALSAERSGDPDLVAAIAATPGLHRVSVATVDDAGTTFAGVGADEHSGYEAGSLTKALTGLVIADAVRRGEVDLDQPVQRYLPELVGSPVGSATMQQLVTHSAGLPPLDSGTRWRGVGAALLARNPYAGVTRDDLIEAAGNVKPAPAGAYAYSNVGAALAGQAVAAAAGTDYPTVMRQRLFQPLGLTETALQVAAPLVSGGYAESGRRQQPWVMQGYAPAGATVTTSADLARVATALLADDAPGMAALQPLAPAGDTPGRQIGIFWQQSVRDGRVITWHNGATGGYHAFLGLDRERGRAVVVLADVSTDAVDDLGLQLIARP